MEAIIFNQNKLRHEIINVYVKEEIKYTAKSGNSTIIPMNNNWRNLGVLVSGGLDSTLLLYLTAKTIKKLNYDIKILPISFEVPSKLKSVKSTNKIVDKIREILDVSFILPTQEFYIPLDQCSREAIDNFNGKNQFMKNSIISLFDEGKLDFNFNGNTKNPPDHIRTKFHNDEFRETSRDTPKSIYNASTSASPHAFMDKADIIDLYIKEGIFDDLAPMTFSCDQFVNRIIEMRWSAPCKHCWWCDERAYGFQANGVEDKALPLPNIWE